MTASPASTPPMPSEAAPDAALQATLTADVATLRAQFPETRALYREVCALLFFRYGITPTANKLYGLVRKGSMGTPTEVLAQFWADLRGKMRVTIDHPGLPEALKAIAADAVQSIWQAANEAAAGELAALRAEARLQASEAEAQRDQARAAMVVAEQETAAIALSASGSPGWSMVTRILPRRSAQNCASTSVGVPMLPFRTRP